ncbi:O-antigen ligase family protein [Paenibacillus sp. J22TS3]|uniref:O-antigen ligase family protein n=1 Tax=Paenibacillus sp. J22TS3 TaxID=2807192 RepID=UPI001B04103E|nr:O-antigen ligase family protein [Paenibacillus sp. J22TS3]GIP21697.1 hypothetical protein J22TS3_19720 [Paenibacillus sp. J22TS3]
MSNPVYGKSITTSRNPDKTSTSNLVLSIALILFLVWAPFQAGLFNGLELNFEAPMYWANIIICVLLLAGIATFFKSFKLDENRELLAISALLLPLSYILALISAASAYQAMNMVLIQCSYAFLFIISVYLLRNKNSSRLIESAIIGIAYLIILFGLLNWLGETKFSGALVGWFSKIVVNGVYTQAVWIDANGPRLASVFQYPNTYAAFLMAIFFVAIFCITRSKKWYVQALHAFMLVPMIVSVLLTLSRGGLVFLPVIFVVLLLFLKPVNQLLWIIYSVISGVAALLISKPVTNLGQQFWINQVPAGKGWIYILTASLAVSAVCLLIQKYVAPWLNAKLGAWTERRLSNLWLPLGSIVIVGLLAGLLIGTNLKNILPGNIGERLDTINLQQHSVLERFTFYRDTIKVVKDYPIIGAGGGAWASLYEKYQNNPYSSRQAHSFFMQYLVEVGLLGFIIFMAFIIYIFYKYIRGYIQSDLNQRESYFIYFILALSILLHSTMDFNMSYVFMGILVFIGLGGMSAGIQGKPLKKFKVKAEAARPLYSIVLGAAAIVLIVVSIRFLQATNNTVAARDLTKSSTDFSTIKKGFDKALSIRSSQPVAVLYESALLQQAYKQTKDDAFYNESLNLLTNALKKEPFNKDFLNTLMAGYQLKNEQEQAYRVLADNADKFAWDISWYEKLIAQSFELGYQSLGQGDTAKRDAYFKTGLEAYDHVIKGIAHLKTLPPGQLQGQPFDLSPTMSLNAGKMQFISKQPKLAADILKKALTADFSNATNREVAIWYLAAIEKSSAKDEGVSKSLLQADPTAKEQIANLVRIF